MNSVKKVFVKRVFVVFAAILMAFVSIGYWSEIRTLFQPNTSDKPLTVEHKPVDGSVLLERFQSAQIYQPTPELIAEERLVDAEQIKLAKTWLLDINAGQRIAGVEQLAAYPTPEAEQAIVDALQKDPSYEVRAAAAVNLSFVKEPALVTQNALINALADLNEEVRFNALNTLQSYLYSFENDNATAISIAMLLKRQLTNKSVPMEIRNAIKNILEDISVN